MGKSSNAVLSDIAAKLPELGKDNIISTINELPEASIKEINIVTVTKKSYVEEKSDNNNMADKNSIIFTESYVIDTQLIPTINLEDGLMVHQEIEDINQQLAKSTYQ